jgi:hypothetical protein
MVAWLKDNGCQMVAMESTGSYEKPLYNIFEQEDLPAMVCNAHHLKNVPGRKTDVNDAQWIAKCLSMGLLNPSFIPDREQRELRELTRFRQSQIQERARNVNGCRSSLKVPTSKSAVGYRMSKAKARRSFWSLSSEDPISRWKMSPLACTGT